MNRETAVKAYRRSVELERTQSNELRERILVKFFDGCTCRQHNCRVNWENGVKESPSEIDGVTYSHGDMAKLSRQFDHEQRRIWDFHTRIQKGIAKHL